MKILLYVMICLFLVGGTLTSCTPTPLTEQVQDVATEGDDGAMGEGDDDGSGNG